MIIPATGAVNSAADLNLPDAPACPGVDATETGGVGAFEQFLPELQKSPPPSTDPDDPAAESAAAVMAGAFWQATPPPEAPPPPAVPGGAGGTIPPVSVLPPGTPLLPGRGEMEDNEVTVPRPAAAGVAHRPMAAEESILNGTPSLKLGAGLVQPPEIVSVPGDCKTPATSLPGGYTPDNITTPDPQSTPAVSPVVTGLPPEQSAASPVWRQTVSVAAERAVRDQMGPPASGAAFLSGEPIVSGSDPAGRPDAPRRENPTTQAAAVSRTEKIAEPAPLPVVAAVRALSSELKEILSPNHKPVAVAAALLGTGVAEPYPSMSPAPSNRTKNASVSQAEFKLPWGNQFTGSLTAEMTAPVATLRETMAAVVSAVAILEQRADAQPQRVDLHFQVGGEPMALRMELKDGIVHTTFQTNSAELGAALRQEWQAVVPAATSGHLRLADPVFNSPAAGIGGQTFGSAGQGALPQRGQAAPESVPFFPAGLRVASVRSDVLPAPAAEPRGLSLLNAFA